MLEARLGRIRGRVAELESGLSSARDRVLPKELPRLLDQYVLIRSEIQRRKSTAASAVSKIGGV